MQALPTWERMVRPVRLDDARPVWWRGTEGSLTGVMVRAAIPKRRANSKRMCRAVVRFAAPAT